MKTSGIYRHTPVALAAVTLLALAGCSRDIDSAVTASYPFPDSLETAVASLVEETRMQEIPGTVRPADRATLSPRVMGVITELPVELGQRVERGEMLAQIAAGEIAARVEQARVAHQQAERDLERESELQRRGAATPESVRNLEDRVQIARAALAEAETMYSYTRISAPFDGVVSRKMANEGDLATPGQPLLEMERTGNLRVEADVPDQLARHLQRGDHLEVLLDRQNKVSARLAEISISADPRTRTVPVKLNLPADAPARSGMFARVFVPAEVIRRIEIPESAVLRFGQVERVMVISDGVARVRLVRTGPRRGEQITILSGLRENEVVILNPPTALRSGQAVTINN